MYISKIDTNFLPSIAVIADGLRELSQIIKLVVNR